MGRDATWVNDDGLVVGFGTRDVQNTQNGPYKTEGLVKEYVIKVYDATQLGDTDTAAMQGYEIPIPANAIIESATFVVDTTFTSGGAAVLDIGVKAKAGTDINDDGIDAAIAVGSLTAGAVISCDGALVGASVGSADAYPYFTYDTAAFTAGAGTLFIRARLDV